MAAHERVAARRAELATLAGVNERACRISFVARLELIESRGVRWYAPRDRPRWRRSARPGSQQVLAAGMVGGGSSDAEQYSHDRRIMVYPVRSWHALLPL